MASQKSCQKLPLCLKGPMPADFRMDMLLAKAEPIRYWQCLRDDVVMKHTTSSSQKGGVRIFERNSPADTKVSGEGRGGGASGVRAEIPLQHLTTNEIHFFPKLGLLCP